MKRKIQLSECSFLMIERMLQNLLNASMAIKDQDKMLQCTIALAELQGKFDGINAFTIDEIIPTKKGKKK